MMRNEKHKKVKIQMKYFIPYLMTWYIKFFGAIAAILSCVVYINKAIVQHDEIVQQRIDGTYVEPDFVDSWGQAKKQK